MGEMEKKIIGGAISNYAERRDVYIICWRKKSFGESMGVTGLDGTIIL
jgi:hypothetical protein